MLVACNNADTTKSERHILIEELKKLQKTLASNDKEKITDIFPFPLSDTAFSIYIDDTTYFEQFKANGNHTTKAMFLQYFKEISENILVDQVNNLFQNIHVDSLLYKDALEYEAYIITKPCYYSYEIEVANDNVRLRMDMNSNKNYKSKNLSGDDIPENSSEICKHAFWWVFKFDGNKLYLVNISGAG
jgi:hypothetical protein